MLLKLISYLPFHKFEYIGAIIFSVTQVTMQNVESVFKLIFLILSSISISVGIIIKILSAIKDYKDKYKKQ